MTKEEDVSKMIKKYGRCVECNARGTTTLASVRCQGCGETIMSNDCKDVDYSITTRKSANFWHTACFGNAWSHGIV